MAKGSFLDLVKKIDEFLKPQGFTVFCKLNEAFFESGAQKYSLKYDDKNRVVFLFNSENVEDGENKSISSWFFDSNGNSQKYIEDVSNDFCKDILSPKFNSGPISKSNYKESESNIEINFFINRLSSVFPDIKEKIVFKKKKEEKFGVEDFLNSEVIPKIYELLSSGNSSKMEKFFKLLENMYKNGNIDVKCIITMGILNNIKKEYMKIANNYINDDFKKVWEASLKYRS